MRGSRFETVAKLRARRVIRFIDRKLGEATQHRGSIPFLVVLTRRRTRGSKNFWMDKGK